MFAPTTLGSVGLTSQNFFTPLAGRQRRPNNIWEHKNRPKFGAIFGNFQLWLWISPERIDVMKSEKTVINVGLLVKKVGELWSTNKKSYRRKCWLTEVDLFGRLLISP